MGKLTKDDILKLAQLARLELTEAEIEQYRLELSLILEYVEQLQDADVDNLQPTHQVSGLVNVFRSDTTKDYGYKPLDLLSTAADVKDNQLKVKRMIG